MAESKEVEEVKSNKFTDFFSNKITKIVSWTVLFVDLVILIIGGAKVEEIDNAYVIIAGIIGGVTALISFITSKTKK